MANYFYLFTICLVVAALAQLALADSSTVERIKKHQEWLNTHNKHKSDRTKFTKWKTSVQPANLWRINKPPFGKQNSSINEVYVENETTSMKEDDRLEPTIASHTILRSHQEQINSTTSSRPTDISTTSATTTTMTTSSSTSMPTLSTALATEPILPPSEDPSTTSSSTTTTTTTTRKPKLKLRPYPRWANWSPWSECSRSCGGGVMHQIRKCIDRSSTTSKTHQSDSCVGLSKRYQLCNDVPCPLESDDIRAYQCAAFDKVDFQGQQYSWEPYIKDDAECELNCKPLGMKYFATLNDTVIDGTPCQRPAEYYRSKSTYASRAMCVDGICKVNVNNRKTNNYEYLDCTM